MKAKTFWGLTPLTQPSPVTCVQTCLAMAVGVPVDEVIRRYGDKAMNEELLQAALTECRVRWNKFTQGTIIFDGWHFATVPSLNHRAGLHQILIHWDAQDGHGLEMLDPAIGDRYATDASNLKSWSDLIAFIPGGTLPEGRAPFAL